MEKFIVIFTVLYITTLIVQTQSVKQSNLERIQAQFLPSEFSQTNFSLEDAKNVLKEKCRKVSGGNETVFIEAQNSVIDFTKCISSIANITTLQQEIQIAKPIGELDTVFSKYCDKRPQVELCVNNFNNRIQSCLNDEEKAHNALMVRVATKLLGFICHKGGDQIALFIAEEGPECLEANKENINSCMNASFAGYLPKNGIPDINNLPQFIMGKKECIAFQDFEKCVIFYLEKCNDITPSNIIESMFKFVNNETKCQTELIVDKAKRNKGNTIFINVTVLSVLTTAIVFRI